ncbi:MAG: mechanosensitive ion channel family protein, partial [Candidatus Zixiibacteriota bacterium]
METYLNMITEWAQEYGMNILGALVIFIIGRMAIGILLSITKKVINKSFKDETLTKFVANLTKMILLTILVIVVLNQLGIQTTSF